MRVELTSCHSHSVHLLPGRPYVSERRICSILDHLPPGLHVGHSSRKHSHTDNLHEQKDHGTVYGDRNGLACRQSGEQSVNPRQRRSVGVVIFFSTIRSYFCFLVAALRPCHGKAPRRKNTSEHKQETQGHLDEPAPPPSGC